MSEQPDESQKTEEPSPKKLADARKKGDVPVSKEVAVLGSMVASILLIAFAGPPLVRQISSASRPFVTSVHDIRVQDNTYDVTAALGDLFFKIFAAMSPLFLAFAGAALLAAFGQNALVFATDRIKPKAERLNPMKGLKRIFSQDSLVELGKNLAKVAVVTGVVALFTVNELENFTAMATYDLNEIPRRMQGMVIKLLSAVLIVMVLIAAIDVIWKNMEYKKKQRMTKQEVKDEFKQTEGDPQVKQRMSEIRRNKARQDSMNQVPNATVLVMNPTHYAVALRYVPEESDAPICIAKGRNLIALKMRDKAREHNVPVVENPPLARALHAGIEEGQPIPPQFFKAVAEVINYVYSTGKRSLTL
ncbi:flagellar biosynthesis protein FlhB [Parvularcula sp. ZS-1/3]|uniref:Flagellar biosynthetic protein FlhB n=1 Tax=Parvularcula mediterranea TaxID=2732508 RepID=A0A7Y3W667_9PROT|nr:flagellar biosynthesis protein FlhB [Parvularcula mediterranea]NNU17394.1 flagellar biosynthesis protein FlhB [Parvularcula mediterranea]